VAGGNSLENAFGWRTTLVMAAVVAIPVVLALLLCLPLATMQMANAVFAFTIALAIAATYLLPKPALNRQVSP